MILSYLKVAIVRPRHLDLLDRYSLFELSVMKKRKKKKNEEEKKEKKERRKNYFVRCISIEIIVEISFKLSCLVRTVLALNR